MKKILTSAGVPKTIIDSIPTVVHTCRICRRWERHSPKCQVSVRLSERFNEVVQFDLIEYQEDGESWYIVHLIDEATRFSTGDICKQKNTDDLLDCFYFCWLRVFGPMSVLVSDQEGALTGHEMESFFAKHAVSLKFKPVGTKAFTVERHNEIVRQGMHRLYDSCVQNSLAIPLRHRLSEVFFYKNALLQYGGYSPYNSVMGIQPSLLPNIEETNLEVTDDTRQGGVAGANRGAVRLRELALQAVQQSCAYSRTLRANNTRTRESAQLKELKVGEASPPPSRHLPTSSAPHLR